MREQLARNYHFFGEEGQRSIERAHVVVFGVGGVGSHLLACLARAGVGELTIVDFDHVSLSSLNRHAFATRAHVGYPKVQVWVRWLRELVPDTRLHVHECLVTPDNVASFFEGRAMPTFVVDCIDNLDAKAALVAYCVKHGIRIVVACGAGMKADPTRIQIRDLSETTYDDLARALRQRLKRHGIDCNHHTGVTVVYSNEHAQRELLPLQPHQQTAASEYRIIKNYRIRIVPVMGAMPALVGYSIASYVLCELAHQPYK